MSRGNDDVMEALRRASQAVQGPSVLVRHYLFSNVISLGGLHTESRIICKVWMGRSKRQLFSRSQGHESQTPYPHRGSSSTANLGGLDVILLEVYFL